MTEIQAPRLALVFIFITMFIDTVGLGLILPVSPQLVAELTGTDMSGAALWGGWLFFVYALMQFLFAPVIGNLSDRFGRRPVLIVSLLALGLDFLITGLAPTIAWLFIGRFLAGAAGASYTTVNAYIADVSPPEQRAANFGLTGAAFSLGFIVGPALGGMLGQFGPRVPFFVAAGLAVVNAAFGWFVMKESLAQEHRRRFEWRRANPLGALRAMSRFPLILPLCLVVIFMRLAHDANPAVFTYYTMLKFGWSSEMIGYALMAVGALMMGVYFYLIRIVIPLIGEAASVYVGLMLGALAFAGYAFASEGWMIFVAMVPFALGAIAGPALNSIMSKTVGPAEQGELQGALACIGGLISIAAPPLLTSLFGYFTGPAAPVYFPGAAFLAGSMFYALAAIVFVRITTARPVVSPGMMKDAGQ